MKPSILCIGALLAALCSAAVAQTISGSIAGTVVDPTGAAVPNAKVAATEQAKKTTSQTLSDSTGRFVFPQLLPGTYTIAVEVTGFKKFERRDLILQATKT